MARESEDAGVYAIRCKETGEVYVGATTNLRNRRAAHFRDLAAGTHTTAALQWLYDEFGEDSMEWVILRQAVGVPADELVDWLCVEEQRWFRELESRVINTTRNCFPRRASLGAETTETAQVVSELASGLVDEFKEFVRARGERIRDHLELALRRHMDNPPPPLKPIAPPLPPVTTPKRKKS